MSAAAPHPTETGGSGGRQPVVRRLRILACGALAGEIEAVVAANRWRHVAVEYLPAALHDRPERIAPAVAARLEAALAAGEEVFVAYADCGTRGALDRLLSAHGVRRLPGAHCYETFAGPESFARLSAEEPGTFFLTDFLVRNFERLVLGGLGLDRHPELRDTYFGNYRRVVFLAQGGDPSMEARARACAARIGLPLEVVSTGRRRLGEALRAAPWPS